MIRFNTKFVFNTLVLQLLILYTKFDWINAEIDMYDMLLDLSLKYERRVFIFDSWDIARVLWMKGSHILYDKGNGIHINGRTSSEIHRVLLICLTNLTFGRFDRKESVWPLRSRYRTIVAESRYARRL